MNDRAQDRAMETNTLTVTANKVLRAEGEVYRYDIDGGPYGMSYEVALEVLEANGYHVVSARGILKIAETEGTFTVR